MLKKMRNYKAFVINETFNTGSVLTGDDLICLIKKTKLYLRKELQRNPNNIFRVHYKKYRFVEEELFTDKVYKEKRKIKTDRENTKEPNKGIEYEHEKLD